MTKSIKEIRAESGLNRKEFSEKFKIPYMTLTDWELHKHKPPEYVQRLLEYYVRLSNSDNPSPFFKNDICKNWDDQKNYRTTFPTVCTHPIVPVKYIYPLRQMDAVNIHEHVKSDPRICNIILFGSSVTMRCQKDSDLDLSIRLEPGFEDTDTKNNISEIIQDSCNYKADIIWFDRINPEERIYSNILKGVQIV